MSNLLHEIQRAVNDEITPAIPKLSSEKSRRDMRATLLALEKMVRHIRQQLLLESKQLTSDRKAARQIKKRGGNNIPQDIDTPEQ